MMDILQQNFYERPTLEVAHDLIGTYLIREEHNARCSGIICETEAYLGTNDSASHASKKKTPRNSVMFGPGGRAYVYFVYGLHYMFNVVTEPDGQAGAVLVRALYPQDGVEEMIQRRSGNTHHIADGPAKLCQALSIDKQLNRLDLTRGEHLWLANGITVPESLINRGPRIGVDYASEKDRTAPYRFWVETHDLKSIFQ